ncbi:MAG: hypothetical protein JJT81_14680 [Rubellimicrobium sp.]|nr:hypothetical protein [Rubellimicrobium sp.]
MLAGFIHAIGLPDRRNLTLPDHAWRACKCVGEADFSEVRPYERILSPDRPPVHLLGLFDMVALVNEPGSGVLTQLRLHAFTSRNPSVAHGLQPPLAGPQNDRPTGSQGPSARLCHPSSTPRMRGA